ncbi:MAG: universal stress protein [Dehalococcoidia bacterium]
MVRKVLVCLDGSCFAEQVLPFAADLASCSGASVVLLQVRGTPTPISTLPGPVVGAAYTKAVQEAQRDNEQRVTAYLQDKAGPLQQRGIDVEVVSIEGEAGDAIVNYARENRVNLIAMATRGHSRLRRLLFGSVADYVVRESGLPVLIVSSAQVQVQ